MHIGAQPRRYAGDDDFTFTPKLLVDFNKDGYFITANLGISNNDLHARPELTKPAAGFK